MPSSPRVHGETHQVFTKNVSPLLDEVVVFEQVAQISKRIPHVILMAFLIALNPKPLNPNGLRVQGRRGAAWFWDGSCALPWQDESCNLKLSFQGDPEWAES